MEFPGFSGHMLFTIPGYKSWECRASSALIALKEYMRLSRPIEMSSMCERCARPWECRAAPFTSGC
jgi:hypothetical protein